MASILVDIGGTHTRLATADKDQLAGIVRQDTHLDESPLDWLAALIKQQAAGQAIEQCIVALPGEIEGSKLITAPNLPNWHGLDLAELDIDCAAALVNDADAAALGEAYYGAGRDKQRFGYVTISTGIGGGLIQDGRLADNQLGFEPGKQLIDWQTADSLEDLAGGASVISRLGVMTGQISDEELLSPIIKQLATGLVNTTLLWSTDCLVVNGPALYESELVWPLLQTEFRQISQRVKRVRQTELVRAELADDAGLYGCLAVANNHDLVE